MRIVMLSQPGHVTLVMVSYRTPAQRFVEMVGIWVYFHVMTEIISMVMVVQAHVRLKQDGSAQEGPLLVEIHVKKSVGMELI